MNKRHRSYRYTERQIRLLRVHDGKKVSRVDCLRSAAIELSR
jgi:hypothetical protein